MVSLKNFPKNFFWGAATSAYQIEGAFDADGKSPSIWDTFSHQPGKIYQNQNGDQACQHYYRWEDDVKLMKDLEINAYRFSISWPRICPDSSKKINQKALDFYSRLIDKLLEQNIEPFVTMFHWDLPQSIQDGGGWCSRDTCELFRDYAYALVEKFSDRIQYWTTLNEPSVVTFAGHFWGVHAPGLSSPDTVLGVLHHLLLAHGLAMQAIRQSFDVKLGIALNLSPVFPHDPTSTLDRQSATLYDIHLYRSFLEALFLKKYPSEMLMQKYVLPGDMEAIGKPMDYLGVNYYTATRVMFDRDVPLFQGKPFGAQPNAYSDMWEFYPEGLSLILEKVWNQYRPPAIYILENGTSLSDEKNDQGRIAYLEAHLQKVSECLEKGIPLKGYFAWSLMDNFEWTFGFSKRFGLVYVDFDTLERKPKASALWYKSLIRLNN